MGDGQVPGLDYGQGYDDAVSVLDLPVGLFAAISPASADLELTAHVRSVSVLNSRSSPEPRPSPPSRPRRAAPRPSRSARTRS